MYFRHRRGRATAHEVMDDLADPPSYANTIVALDRSGHDLHRIERLFFNLTASETSDDLQAIERDISPQLAAHRSAIAMDSKLFARIEAVNDRRDELPRAEAAPLVPPAGRGSA